MDREKSASVTSSVSEDEALVRKTRRTVTFHLPPRLPGTRHEAASRFQEVVRNRKEQRSKREEHRRRTLEARIMADEALERVSPSALMTDT